VKKNFSFILLLSVVLVSGCNQDKEKLGTSCELPKKYYKGWNTFYDNPNLNCGANTIIYAAPVLFQEVQASQPGKRLEEMGRIHYESLAQEFEGTKESVETQDEIILGRDNTQIPIRFYAKGKKNILMYVHGGGWSRGNLRTHDALCRKLSKELDCTVIAIEYRLAPENPYPAGLNDVEDLYQHLLKNNSHERLILAGDSAGGNLSAALLVRLIESKKQLPKQLILIYPALDLTVPEKSQSPIDSGYLLTRESINNYVKNYTGGNMSMIKNPEVSPSLANDEILKHFPPTLLISAQYDPLTHQGELFNERLKTLGVPSEQKIIHRTIHIFAQFFGLFKEETNTLFAFLKEKVKF
jgi:acetyl esterase